ncbi:uncharacterized protein METZ01_LOCUS444310, partial [marine metagenome]
MLETVLILPLIFVELGRIHEIVIFFRNDVVGTLRIDRQVIFFRMIDFHRVPLVTVDMIAVLVPQVGRRLSVSERLGTPHSQHRTVVGRQHDG